MTYYFSAVLENQNTQKENQKLNLTFRQEALIKEQSKIFHETYSKGKIIYFLLQYTLLYKYKNSSGNFY